MHSFSQYNKLHNITTYIKAKVTIPVHMKKYLILIEEKNRKLALGLEDSIR